MAFSFLLWTPTVGRMLPSTLRVDLHLHVNLSGYMFIDTPKGVFNVILSLVRLTMKINLCKRQEAWFYVP